MYICVDCGKVFDEEEISVWHESRGVYWGEPCTEKMYGCPNCKGEFVKAKKCKICGDWLKEYDWDICEECYSKYMTKETCLEIGKENASTIKLNDFIVSNFSKEEIEKIVMEKFQENAEKIANAVKDYCEYDMSYFVDWVGKKWNEEK